MQQFVVPQFIEVEDKIFGPITIRQFLILLVGGGIVFFAWRYGDLALFALVLTVVGGLSLMFAFVKVNGQTFHYFLLNIIQTMRQPGLRVWKKKWDHSELEYLRKLGTEKIELAPAPRKQPRRQRIRDLALVVNTGGFYQAEDEA